MKRNGAKGLMKKRTTRAKAQAVQKVEHSKRNRVSAKERARIAHGQRTLQELFTIGEETFKRLDTKTIIRVAEDKDLEYM
jgi:hypothetical protein